jgi:uncharacterized protein
MSERWVMRGLVCAAVVALAASAQAASFDCKKAASRIEHLICDDPDLNSYDSQLQGAYAGALDRSLHAAQVTADQRAWLRQRDACADAKCLSPLYQARIAALAKISDPPATCSGETTIEVNQCQAEESRRADRELARYVAAARARLLSEAGDSDNSAKALAGLDVSQKAWEAFRKAECDAVYDWWSDGTIRGAMYEDCVQAVTRSRTEQVWQSWLQFMDSTPPLMPRPAQK